MYQAQKNPVWLEYAVTCYLQVRASGNPCQPRIYVNFPARPPVQLVGDANVTLWHLS